MIDSMTKPGLARLTRRTALVAGAATLAAPRIGGAQPAAVKVGVIHPVTGALAFSGSQCRLGAWAPQ